LNNQGVINGLSLTQWTHHRSWWGYYPSGGSCICIARMTL